MPSREPQERKTTRTTQVVEIELHSPLKFEKAPKTKAKEKASLEPLWEQKTEDQGLEGNRGYLTESISPEIATSAAQEKYTVKKGDTLQKISKACYGTTKKWTKIYEANKDTLKGPNKIYPGQVINIPVEPLQETQENLK